MTRSPAEYSLQFRVTAAPTVPADECSFAQYAHPGSAGIDAGRCRLDCVAAMNSGWF